MSVNTKSGNELTLDMLNEEPIPSIVAHFVGLGVGIRQLNRARRLWKKYTCICSMKAARRQNEAQKHHRDRKKTGSSPQNKYAWIPMLIVPLIFVVVLPLVYTLVIPALQVNPQDVISSDQDIEFFVDRMPESLSRYIDFDKPMESMIVIMLGFMLAPMFLILPLMYSTVIASESFAGERERKTIEALLYTSASDADLLLGKLARLPPPRVGVTWLGFAVYTLILNLAPYAIFSASGSRCPRWPLIFWITPAVVVFGIALTVIISGRVRIFWALINPVPLLCCWWWRSLPGK